MSSKVKVGYKSDIIIDDDQIEQDLTRARMEANSLPDGDGQDPCIENNTIDIREGL